LSKTIQILLILQHQNKIYNSICHLLWKEAISTVTLKVYDILGNEVATLVDEEKEPGVYEVEFSAASHSGNVRNLASGIYIYRLQSSEFSNTKKMILLQ
jgi:hypothetical protein